MAQTGKVSDLHRLVESTFHAQRKDIHDYAGGHLNPDKLVKLPVGDDSGSHVPWKSSQGGGERDENFRSRLAESRKNADFMLVNRLGIMQNALLDFSVGTVGMLPQTRKKIKKKKKAKRKTNITPLQSTKSETKLESFVLSEIAKLMSEQDGPYSPLPQKSVSRDKKHLMPVTPRKKYVLPFGSKRQSALTEELKLPELMLPAVDESARVPPSLKDPGQIIRQNVHEITNKKFVTTHLAGITRKDRFDKMLDFDRNVLHRYETMEKNVRDGHKAADHLEQKLVRRLLSLQNQSRQINSPNFERLQTYGEVWQDLSVDSLIFGSLLLQIKTEYDKYLTDLLDEMKATDHAELVKCLSSTKGLSQYDDNDIEMQREDVESMEEEARQGVLRNSQLHQTIEKQKALIEEKRKQRELEEEQNRRRLIPNKISTKTVKVNQIVRQPSAKREKNTEKRLKDLRFDVWERLDKISQKKDELRTDFVPKSLYRNLQHAVQDTENEMQKLMQQNEYLTKNMAIQEESLKNDLAKFDSVSKENLTEMFLELGIVEKDSQ